MSREGSSRIGLLRQDLLERLDHDIGVDTGGHEWIGFGLGLRRGQGIELGDDQAV